MHRVGFWYIVVIVVAVALFGVGTAMSLNGSIMSTAGSTIRVVVSGVPDFVNSFKGGASGGAGNDPAFSFGQQQARPKAQQDRQVRNGDLNAARRGDR